MTGSFDKTILPTERTLRIINNRVCRTKRKKKKKKMKDTNSQHHPIVVFLLVIYVDFVRIKYLLFIVIYATDHVFRKNTRTQHRSYLTQHPQTVEKNLNQSMLSLSRSVRCWCCVNGIAGKLTVDTQRLVAALHCSTEPTLVICLV